MITLNLTGNIDAVERVVSAELRIIELWWKSGSGFGGKVDAWLDLHGIVDRIVTKPDPGNPPIDNWDLEIRDDRGVDLLNGQLFNRDTTSVECVWPYGLGAAANRHQECFLPCRGNIMITNAGSLNEGMIAIYLLTLPVVADTRSIIPA